VVVRFSQRYQPGSALKIIFGEIVADGRFVEIAVLRGDAEAAAGQHVLDFVTEEIAILFVGLICFVPL
jgi:hypothetical protein